MDIRELTILAAQHEDEAVKHLARVSAQASALANKIHAGGNVSSITLTMVSQHLDEATIHLAKAQTFWGVVAQEKAQPKTDPSHKEVLRPEVHKRSDLENKIDSILYEGLAYESGLTPKIMDAIKQERNG